MYRFQVPYMSCGGCAKSVTKALQSVDADAVRPPGFGRKQHRRVPPSAVSDDLIGAPLRG